MNSPALPVRLRRRVERDLRLVAANSRSPRARFGRGCDVRAGLVLTLEGRGRVDVGPDCVLDRGLTLWSAGVVEIGANTVLGHHVTLAARDRLTIGRDCLLAELVSVRDHDHALDRTDVPIAQQGERTAPVRIGDDVWIGAKATVVRGVTIGDHAVVGAGAVVTADVPDWAVVVGVPARVVRSRHP
ncbi:acyltransferase [Jatrophihabitans sp. YIM 134969]